MPLSMRAPAGLTRQRRVVPHPGAAPARRQARAFVRRFATAAGRLAGLKPGVSKRPGNPVVGRDARHRYSLAMGIHTGAPGAPNRP